MYAAGLLIFIRRRGAGRDRRSLLDALTVTVSLALLSWMYLILPYVHNSALSWQQKAVSIAYPIGDVLVLAMLARLLLPGTWRTRSLQLLTLGTLGLLASDVSFGLLQLYGSFHVGTATDLGWIVFYAAWGAAALHPSMTRLTEPVTPSQPPSSALPAGPDHARRPGRPRGAVRRVLRRDRDRRRGHRGLLRPAVRPGAVTPRGCRVRAAPGARPGAGPAAGGGRAGRGRDRGAGVRRDPVRGRPAAARTTSRRPRSWPCGTTAASAWSVRPAGRHPSPRTCLPSWPRTGRPCSPGLPARLLASQDAGTSGSVLLCPLALKDRPSGDPLIGVLAVSGSRQELAALAGTLEVLARQAALVVERVLLSREVIRRNSEAYFRTLVHDTSDVILIVDDSDRVRYATPSAAEHLRRRPGGRRVPVGSRPAG